MATVHWVKAEAGNWLDFQAFDLDSVGSGVGVYVIWYNGQPGRVVRVGQGGIKDRLGRHRQDPAITAYAGHGLLVTWVEVASQAQRDGIERYLADQYPPLVGDAWPDVQPIAVNSPWS